MAASEQTRKGGIILHHLHVERCSEVEDVVVVMVDVAEVAVEAVALLDVVDAEVLEDAVEDAVVDAEEVEDAVEGMCFKVCCVLCNVLQSWWHEGGCQGGY